MPSGLVLHSSGNRTRLPHVIANIQNISSRESAYLDARKNITNAAVNKFLTRANLTGFDATSFLANYTPKIGLAFSGGGYRAMLNGAGAFQAMDSRQPGSTSDSGLGGLVQSASYLAGLSGGSWLVGSIYVNNFTTIQALISDPMLWNLTELPIYPAGDNSFFASVGLLNSIRNEVDSKNNAGYNTTITDYWGLALARQFFNGTDGGLGLTWSDIQNSSAMKMAMAPWPIVIADERFPGQTVISDNSSVFEINPYEMGSWDPTLYAFTDLQFIGTIVRNGTPTTRSCTEGFDASSFIIGTSSSLFNEALLKINGTGLPSPIRSVFTSLLSDFSKNMDDISIYEPNPFRGYQGAANPSAMTNQLTLVDGGEDGQNIPLNPLIQPVRNVDVIFAVDSSADTANNWPNGTSLVATYQRSLAGIQNKTAFPAIPDQNTFVALGLNNRPTWFGCNSSNQTGPTPLIVYLPNAPVSFFSNVSTFNLTYTDSQLVDVIQNGYNVATQGNGTLNTDWLSCVGCAIIQRETERQNQTASMQCQDCMSKYCWNGTVATTTAPMYAPTPVASP